MANLLHSGRGNARLPLLRNSVKRHLDSAAEIPLPTVIGLPIKDYL